MTKSYTINQLQQQAIYQSENSHVYMYVSILHLIMIYIIILYICTCYMCHTDSHTSSSTHYHVNSPNDAFWCHFGLWYVFLFFLFFIYSLYQLRAMQCHAHGPNDACCVSFRLIVSFFALFQILLLLLPFYHLRLMQHNTTVTYTNHHPLPLPCTMSMA